MSKTVPDEPTEEMIVAAMSLFPKNLETGQLRKDVEDVYQAMLAAAPAPKPDVVRYAIAAVDKVYVCNEEYRPTDNLRLTFDGETLKLKSAEVIA